MVVVRKPRGARAIFQLGRWSREKCVASTHKFSINYNKTTTRVVSAKHFLKWLQLHERSHNRGPNKLVLINNHTLSIDGNPN
jgi:hypothetical protein